MNLDRAEGNFEANSIPKIELSYNIELKYYVVWQLTDINIDTM